MNTLISQNSTGSTPRLMRWGVGLALVAVLYIAAVVLFIIVY